MQIRNLKDFYIFVQEHQIYGVERFVGMYDMVEKFCGGCRRSDYLRAIQELTQRYKDCVSKETIQWQNFVSNNTEDLIFFCNEEKIAEFLFQGVPK